MTWLNLRDRDDAPERMESRPSTKAAPLLERGCRPQVAARPLIIEFNLRNPFLFGSMNSIKPAFGDKSVEAQKKFYAERGFPPHLRRRTRTARGSARHLGSREDQRSRQARAQGAGVEKRRRKSHASATPIPLEVFFDLAIEDDLNLTYMMPLLDINEERVARKFSDPRTMIGISDGGAHVDMLCNAGYPTYLIGNFVRGKQALTLEHAVKRITSEPAHFFGMSRSRRAAARLGGGHHDFRFRSHRLARASRSPQRLSRRRTPAGDAGARASNTPSSTAGPLRTRNSIPGRCPGAFCDRDNAELRKERNHGRHSKGFRELSPPIRI